MKRLFFASFFSIFIVFALFLIMQKIIFQNQKAKISSISYDMVDFIKLQPKKKLEEKREKKKELQKKIIPKKVHMVQSQKITMKNIKVETPKLDLPLDFKQNANLNDIAVVQSPLKENKEPLAYSSDIMPIFATPPTYPRIAKRRNIEGYVIVFFTIDKKGNVKNINIKKAEPKGFFEKAASDAIKRWKFNAKILNGVAVEQLAQQRLEFKLR